MLNASQRRVNKNSLTWWYVLKTSWRYLCKTSLRHLQNVLQTFFKTSWRCLKDAFARRLENVSKTSWQDVLKTSWRRLEKVLKTYGQDEHIGLDQDVLKTSSEDVRLRRTYSSWSRRLEDVFRRQRRKTPSRHLRQGECLLAYLLILTFFRTKQMIFFRSFGCYCYFRFNILRKKRQQGLGQKTGHCNEIQINRWITEKNKLF